MPTDREALKGAEAWLANWARHIGDCGAGDECTCGLTAIRHEAVAALSLSAPPEVGEVACNQPTHSLQEIESRTQALIDQHPGDGLSVGEWVDARMKEAVDRARASRPDPSAEDVERVARAICKARGWNPETCIMGGGSSGVDGVGTSYCSLRMWQNCIPEARAVLAALSRSEVVK